MNLPRTQVGGKFASNNPGLFTFKKALQEAGAEVAFPIGDSIIATEAGVELTFSPQDVGKTFRQMEDEYLHAIETCSFHSVYNRFGLQDGYLGVSASMESAVAMLYNRPIVMVARPVITARVPSVISKIILRHAGIFFYCPEATVENLRLTIVKLPSYLDYQLSQDEIGSILTFKQEILASYG